MFRKTVVYVAFVWYIDLDYVKKTEVLKSKTRKCKIGYNYPEINFIGLAIWLFTCHNTKEGIRLLIVNQISLLSTILTVITSEEKHCYTNENKP